VDKVALGRTEMAMTTFLFSAHSRLLW